MMAKPIALVTGGAGGLGSAISRELAVAGFSVGIHFFHGREAADCLAKELPDAFIVEGDLASETGVEAVFEQIKARDGLAVLVNNAGIAIDAPLFSAKLSDFDTLIDTNLRSAWYLTKKLSRLMIRKRAGNIINISSVVGSTGNPAQSVYGMTKAALDNFTKTLAVELASYNILVNSVAPGFIETSMTRALSPEVQQGILARIPLGRMGQPVEVARLVRFLVAEGSYCTGSVFHINGGLYGG